jgi:hypothetical protein
LSIDSLNGKNLSITSVRLKALSKVKIYGTVKTSAGKDNASFNGEGILTIFDSQKNMILSQVENVPIWLPGGVLFRSRISVTNGKFNTEFTMPKDISYEDKNGKIVVYFFNAATNGIGASKNITVGGTDTSVINDGKGPEIEIYIDNTANAGATLANPNSKVLVKLSDETGINTTGTGIGHKLEGILNNDESNPIDFTNYFVGDIDAGGKTGVVNYSLNNLASGSYNMLVKAWDVYNNYSKSDINFTVVNGDGLEVREVYNYPNPFSSKTLFTFQQNLNSVINVKIKIYTIAGRLIKVIERTGLSDKFVKIEWDGRDEDGSILANGTYFYKLIVDSQEGNYHKEVIGKLAVAR